jgi:hypothetical protein
VPLPSISVRRLAERVVGCATHVVRSVDFQPRHGAVAAPLTGRCSRAPKHPRAICRNSTWTIHPTDTTARRYLGHLDDQRVYGPTVALARNHGDLKRDIGAVERSDRGRCVWLGRRQCRVARFVTIVARTDVGSRAHSEAVLDTPEQLRDDGYIVGGVELRRDAVVPLLRGR